LVQLLLALPGRSEVSNRERDQKGRLARRSKWISRRYLSDIVRADHWTEGATCKPRAPAQSIDQSTDEEILSVIEFELPKKIGDMEFCRAFSNVQLVRNLLVREVPEEKLEHLAFPCSQ
jgi:hypothetical protein